MNKNSSRSNALAERLEAGAKALASFAGSLSRAEWALTVPRDGRKVGVIVHQLDRAAPVSLNGGAPLTCQFLLEDHAVRHSYHHLAQIRAALSR